jgi:uncharacterized protein (TIGR02231 family)
MRAIHAPAALFALTVLVSQLHGAAATAPTTAPSRVVSATVYQGSAMVTREVQVPAGTGAMELIVTPLPSQTVDSSLYSEGTDGVRILATRFRSRAVQKDTRAEVRAREDRIRELQLEAEKLQKQISVAEQNLQLLAKLEGFTGATMQHLADKGLLNGQTTIELSKFVMEQRTEKSDAITTLQQQLRANAEAQQFAQRELSELTAGASRTERDAVIAIDKANEGPATIRLNYLVSSATWRPQYKLRAAAEEGPVQLEYLASIVQQSGENWTDADIVLSTAEPMLSAAPPELTALDITVSRPGDASKAQAPLVGAGAYSRISELRQQVQRSSLLNDYDAVNRGSNEAAAVCQTDELLNSARLAGGVVAAAAQCEGPSVTYHLKTKFSIPSRNDEQLIEFARIDLKGDFFYKATPVLTPHVYRIAKLINTSEYVLLPGQATMYLGTDFVGRMNLPLVAIGENFTAGFGVDPQLQVARDLADKNRSVQGGNQVHELRYSIRIASFKSKPVKMQVWDRLPKAEAESVGVTLLNSTPPLSTDATYERTDRTKNLLRWDLTVEPDTNGERATTITYQFKLEYDRNVSIGDLKAAN